jgi:protein involved in polysaccharide export with SLBB domain
VLDARLLGPRDSVQIIGAVTKDSVELQYAANLRLQDMIDLAGGLRIDAGLVEIVRRKVGADFSDTTSVVTSIPVAPDGSIPIAAGNQTLERGDRIFVRSSPGYVASRSVILDGQFVRPGTYILARENETVAEVIKRAGGILPTGAPTTFRLIREGRVVPIGLEDVLAGRNVRENIPLVHGDILTVERTPTTVLVIGAVQRQVAVPYREGWRLRDYISAAGGFTSDATRGVVTEAPDGAVSVKTLHAMPFIDGPRVFPGSVVTAVAKVPTSDAAFRDSISFALQVTSALATLLVTLVLLKR